jgi:hypothetical protein
MTSYRGSTDVTMIGPTHMETASGLYFDVLNPDPDTVRLGDIAHHLARINRYTGAARRPISVAEHALLVADRLRCQCHTAAVVLAGLHHDDHEAYTGDIGRPLKNALTTTLGLIEDRINDAIDMALGLPPLCGGERAIVKAADDWALSAEAHYLMPSRGKGWVCDGLFDPGVDVPALERLRRNDRTPEDIERRWLRFHTAWMGVL